MQNTGTLRIGRFIILAVVASLALTACQAALPAAAGHADDFSLTLVHSNDTWGYTDPCG